MLGYYIVYGFKCANDMTLNPKDTKDTVNGSINANICKLFFFFKLFVQLFLSLYSLVICLRYCNGGKIVPQMYLGPCQTRMMGLFCNIVNRFIFLL